MKEPDSVEDHVNKMMVIAKDLIMVENIIYEPMQIFIILNSYSPSWDIAIIVIGVKFNNPSLYKLPLLLEVQQDQLNKRNNNELMIV